MPKIEYGPMVGMKGTLDGYTFYSIKGNTYVRKKKKISENSMAALQRQSNKTKGLSYLYKFLKETILDSAFRIEAVRLNMKSGYNLFNRENSKAINKDTNVGDYSFLNLCVGTLDNPFQFRGFDASNGVLNLEWDTDCLPERENDRLMVAVIHDHDPFRIVVPDIPVVTRKDGEASIDLKNENATEAHVYCFFVNKEKD